METWRTFSLIFTKISAGVPEVMKGWGLFRLRFQAFSPFKLFHTQSPAINKLLFMFSYQSLAPGSFCSQTVILSIHPSLRVQGSNLPSDLNSLRDLIKVINFPFVQPFPCEDWMNDFHAVYMSDQKTRVDIFYISHAAVIEEDWFKKKKSSCFCDSHQILAP